MLIIALAPEHEKGETLIELPGLVGLKNLNCFISEQQMISLMKLEQGAVTEWIESLSSPTLSCGK